jgi:hypothetical protein
MSSYRPMGILPNASLTKEQLTSLRVLDQFDLSRIRTRLLDDATMPSTWVDEAIFEFKRYIGIYVIIKTPMPMFSRHVDLAWHACLLFSRLYADLCQQVVGDFVHHEPVEQGEIPVADRWDEFRAAYEALYGDLGRLWLIAHPHRGPD